MPEYLHVELVGDTQRLWNKISLKKREVYRQESALIAKVDRNKILFVSGAITTNNIYKKKNFEERLRRFIRRNVGANEYVGSLSLEYAIGAESLPNIVSSIPNFEDRFQTLSFGSDVAEQDTELLRYFLETSAYDRVQKFQKGIIIGPKGSGKSSILKSLAANTAAKTIIITPEVFATSMLKKIVEEGGSDWEEERAFVATWEFSILFEVFKQFYVDAKGLPKPALVEIDKFLKQYSDFDNSDLFSRFVRFLKKIQNVKLSMIEISAKTKELQDLFALEPVYNLILKIRKYLRRDVLILVDELDQGWDNSEHSNRFLASLMQAAVQIQNLGIQAHVIVFVRSEIFDLVRTKLDQLDKIRSSIERLRWSDGELMELVVKRISHHFAHSFHPYKARDILTFLFDPIEGRPGFEYLISRTTKRPREVLQFSRLAHQYAIDQRAMSITADSLIKAEEEFSNWKLEHVSSEYMNIYPELESLLRMFRGKQSIVSKDDVEFTILEFQDEFKSQSWAQREPSKILNILYQIEFIGVTRVSSTMDRDRDVEDFEFFYESPSPNLNMSTDFLIHPAFWSALEIGSQGHFSG